MPEPTYRRIADDLRQRIESGILAPGSRLPTEVALRDSYRVSRNTIRDALKWLLNRGLVETRHGQGTFVARKYEPFVTTLSGDWQTRNGHGGGEGQAAREEVRARNRTTRTSAPTVGIQPRRRERRHPAPRPGGHERGEPPSGALHRRGAVVAADQLLPDAAGGYGGTAPAGRSRRDAKASWRTWKTPCTSSRSATGTRS